MLDALCGRPLRHLYTYDLRLRGFTVGSGGIEYVFM